MVNLMKSTLKIMQYCRKIPVIHVFIAIFLFSGLSAFPAEREISLEKDGGAEISIGILYKNDDTGRRHCKAIEKVLKAAPDSGMNINLETIPYSEVHGGLEDLKRLMTDNGGAHDIILGPTESDIFVRAIELQENLAANQVTVISGLVTAVSGNKRDGWFFRINVDIQRRVQAVCNYIKRYWISTINSLYEDSEYGRTAERAFKDALGSEYEGQRYSSYIYTSPDPFKQLETIVKNRPEAIGLFCQRAEIIPICQEIKRRNYSGADYNPIIFTIIDVSSIAGKIDEIHFVSLNDIPENEKIKYEDFRAKDDVVTLGNDLSQLVLRVLKDIKNSMEAGTTIKQTEFRKVFRDQLVNLLQSSTSPGDKQEEKNLNFVKFSNITLPNVFKLDKNDNISLLNIEGSAKWPKKIGHKFVLVVNVYGLWVLVSFLVIVLIAFLISRMEVKRYFPSKHIKFYKTRIFPLFLGGHITVVVIIIVFLAETGRLNYDDLLMIILISMTPTAFLRTTFFETRYGKTFGLENIYKNVMSWMENRIMRERYSNVDRTVNMIAYYNGEDAMKKALIQLYKKHPSAVQRAKLIQRLEEDLANEPEYLNRRRICAKHLLKQFDREELKAEGFIPRGWDFDNPPDPRKKIREIAKICSGEINKINRINEKLEEQLDSLKKRNPKKYEEICDFKNAELANVIAVEGELIVKLRILYVLMAGVDLNSFEKEFFPDKNKEKKG